MPDLRPNRRGRGTAASLALALVVLGANVLLFAFNATGANLRHSHVRISYGRRLERFLMSPAQHQIHHSVEERHHDRNFGTALALWDWIGGTLHLAEKGADLRYGLGAGAAEESNSLSALYVRPVLEAGHALHGAAISVGLLPTRLRIAAVPIDNRPRFGRRRA